MKVDLIIALRNRWVQGTLLFSLLLRLVLHFFYLPERPSEYGPDEGTYGLLAGYVADGLPVEEFPGWGASLYHSSKTLIVPSSILIRLGITDLEAVRTISSLYGLLSTLFLVLSFIAILKSGKQELRLEDYNVAFVLPLVFFTFLPSNFLWSTLGLRESSSQFWLISAFYFLLKLYFEAGKSLYVYLVLTSLSLIFSFGARKETALVFTFSTLIMGAFLVITKRKGTILIAAILGLVGGQLLSTTPQAKPTEVFYLLPTKDSASETPSPTPSMTVSQIENGRSKSPAPKKLAPFRSCSTDGQQVQIQEIQYICERTVEYKKESINPLSSTKEQIIAVSNLEETRKARSIDAKSALPISSCKTYSSQIQTLIMCNLKELPYRLVSFLLRPFPLIDTGSNFSHIAGLENVIWLLLFLYTIYLMKTIRVRTTYKFVIASLSFYVISFSTLAALYEGNLGTAFRHKSSILWPLMIILLVLKNKKGAIDPKSSFLVR